MRIGWTLLVLLCTTCSLTRAQDLPPLTRLAIPFGQIRDFLPRDGEVAFKHYGKVVWPEFGEDNPFERHESFELAFGKGVRAEAEHRNPEDEKPLGPGIVAKNGYLQLTAGWRAKVKAPLNDHFDGTVSAKLSLEMNGGVVRTRLYDVNLAWNKGLGDAILDEFFDIRGKMESALRDVASREIEPKLNQTINEELDELSAQLPAIKTLRENVFVRIEPDTLVISVADVKKTVRVRLPSLKYTPPHTRGDEDFDGDPAVRVELKFYSKPHGVFMSVFLSLKEQCDDWTTAEGWSEPQLVYQPEPGWTVHGLPGRTNYTDLVNQVVGGHDPVELGTHLGKVVIVADTDGNEAGTRSNIQCNFDDEIVIALEPQGEELASEISESVHFPRSISFMPPHTRGDQEFDGYGPQVWVDTKLETTASTVAVRVRMKAEETTDDWTTAEGWSEPAIIYKAPAGYVISSVGDTMQWSNIVHYTDNNHDADVFNTELGQFICYGDCDGDDVGHYTRVVANFTKVIRVTSRLSKP